MDPETANQTDINTRFFNHISKGQTVSGKIKRQKTNILNIFFKEKVNLVSITLHFDHWPEFNSDVFPTSIESIEIEFTPGWWQRGLQ